MLGKTLAAASRKMMARARRAFGSLKPRRSSYPAPRTGILRFPRTGARQGKRALLSYINVPLNLPRDDRRRIQFSNYGIARSIVQVLNGLGYTVDVVEWNDLRFLPKRPYELFIGHGGLNFRRIACALPREATKIYFSTGPYWRFFNAQELARFAALQRRRGIRLNPDRLIDADEEWATRNADAIICLGNEQVRESYSDFPVVYNLNNAAYPDAEHIGEGKDFAEARNNFLFFSGGGNVHKGLDLLLEAFRATSSHLYICQDISPDFRAVYKEELELLPNIHLVGWIAMRSVDFYGLVGKCAYVIHPSCAEGQPGGVIECMHQGLVPVVSRESNIDVDGFGLQLWECSIREIVDTVEGLSKQPPEWCEKMSERTRDAAKRTFSVEAFLERFTMAVEDAIVKSGAEA